MSKTVFPPVNPPFHFLGNPLDGRFFGRGIRVTTTTDLNYHYHDKLNQELTWVEPSTVLGSIRNNDGKIETFHPSGPYLGECNSRWEAAEFLLGLYLAQNKPA